MSNNLVFRLVDWQMVEKSCTAIADFYNANPSDDVFVMIYQADVDKQRTKAQNRLYWLWIKQISDKTGQDKETIHHEFKKKHLARIFNRDDEYKQTFVKVRACKGVVEPYIYDKLVDGVVSLLSTTKANTKQMTEYLDDVWADMYAKGIFLTIPQELEWVRT